jgi:hypothetical protein
MFRWQLAHSSAMHVVNAILCVYQCNIPMSAYLRGLAVEVSGMCTGILYIRFHVLGVHENLCKKISCMSAWVHVKDFMYM